MARGLVQALSFVEGCTDVGPSGAACCCFICILSLLDTVSATTSSYSSVSYNRNTIVIVDTIEVQLTREECTLILAHFYRGLLSGERRFSITEHRIFFNGNTALKIVEIEHT